VRFVFLPGVKEKLARLIAAGVKHDETARVLRHTGTADCCR
jgi:hypothetical protein